MHGLYLLWWVGDRGLSPAIVAALVAAGDVALFALEVPTGWVADRVGHRVSLIAGSLLQVAGMLACWLGDGVVELAAACLLVALGDAFRSGADEALLYRTCVALGRERDFLPIAARTRAAGLLALVLFTLGGGWIVQRWSFAAGWLLETMLCAAGAVMAWALVEPPPAEDPPADASPAHKVVNVERRGRQFAAIIRLALPAAILGAGAGAAAFLTQVSHTASPVRATMAVAAIAVAEAAGAWCAARTSRSRSLGQWMLLGAAAGVVSTAGWLPGATEILALLLAFLAGVAVPWRADLLQRTTTDRFRARTASLASACDMALSALALSLAGAWHGRRR